MAESYVKRSDVLRVLRRHDNYMMRAVEREVRKLPAVSLAGVPQGERPGTAGEATLPPRVVGGRQNDDT